MLAAVDSILDAPSGPLTGLKVLDLTVNVLGPLCTQILGDMGADVLKIEVPEGDPMRFVGPSRSDGMSVLFLNLNRNKRSIVLNLKNESARLTLLQLIESADVLVHSMRPEAARRLGIDYETIRDRFPKLIYASASGYRPNSSRRDWPAFDDVIQAASGMAFMNAVDGRPRYVPTVFCDKFSGHALASSIAMALYARERNGTGQQVNVPMLETMVAFNMVEHLWGGVLDAPELGVGYRRMLAPERRPYETKDGFVALLAVTDSQWLRLFAAIDLPELAHDPRFSTISARTENIERLYEILAEQIRTRSTADWLQRLSGSDIPSGVVNSFEDLLSDEYLRETAFFRRIQHPSEGTMVSMAIPAGFSATPPSLRRLPPRLGEHSEEILAELTRQDLREKS